ncbi:unnamed protein product [Triticum turgidum subsp. durum]|uniref:RWD domain-containing protein n=1 Tax=Triticum turgidum subsp. durum TaxID=4567 RepID=A0A9R1QGZ5_TRITD|nr:unnamed protein product [Triticum turgidum subsp. durum]
MEDYEQEQEMELEALQAILMDDIKEIDPSESGIDTNSRCFEILLSPQDDDFDEAAHVPVQMALVFAHTEKYPDEPPLVNIKSVRGIKPDDLTSLKEKLDQEATENLGMAMIYTLLDSAKEWLTEKYGQNAGDEEPDETEEPAEEVFLALVPSNFVCSLQCICITWVQPLLSNWHVQGLHISPYRISGQMMK